MKNLKKGVISELLGRAGETNPMQDFIHKSKFTGVAEPYLFALQEQYDSLQNELKRAALLEEIILLHQYLANQLEPKFSLVNRYIYARASVYRADTALNDIRVVVEAVNNNHFYEDMIQEPLVITRAKNLLTTKVKNLLDEKLAYYHTNYGPVTMQVA